MKTFKVGDTIQIKSIEWYNEHKDDDQGRMFIGGRRFRLAMAEYCGKAAKINSILIMGFKIDIDPEYGHVYTAGMFENQLKLK